MFRRRSFNIESLTVGHTHQDGISRITIVVDSDKTEVERIMPYMYKLINVIQVEDLTETSHVSRDLAMVKVSATPENRSAVMQLAEVFRARIVDVANTSLIIEITGDEEKVDGFVEVLRPYGIIEMVRNIRWMFVMMIIMQFGCGHILSTVGVWYWRKSSESTSSS